MANGFQHHAKYLFGESATLMLVGFPQWRGPVGGGVVACGVDAQVSQIDRGGPNLGLSRGT